MADRLESAWLKLDRAHEHRETFSRLGTERGHEITRPWPLSHDPENDEFTLTLGKVPSPKPGLSLVLGDAVHNYRSALDHLAFQLVKHPDRKPREKRTPDGEISFPICASEKTYCAKSIQGAADRAKDEIRAIQPFNLGWDPLLVLKKLDDRDKHRTIHLVTHTISAGFLRNDVLASSWLIGAKTPIKDARVLARWKFRPDADRQADIGPFIGLGFEFAEGIAKGAEVLGVLDRIDYTVRAVIDRLARYVAP